MILDLHVHISATTPGRGKMSPRLLKSIPFRFMRWKFGIKGTDPSSDRAIEAKLADTISGATKLDAAVVLAFDAVHDGEGNLDDANTHLYVTNDYVIELAARHKNMLFGCSVHPYRKDAVAEIERCVKAGAVLCKWLPIVQNFNPADKRCFPFYEALAHHKLPLLSHTGGEKTLPCLDLSVADPKLLLPAVERGVTVIAAHCGTRSAPGETDFLPNFAQMAQQHENFFGDTAALNMPTRSYAWQTLLKSPALLKKLVHGSDWPIPAFPPFRQLGFAGLRYFRENNWMHRDTLIKEKMGLGDDYWRRAAKVLRIGLSNSQ
ncbi:MAG TPA: amidohydrolase family protein [Tepidisphaeraceae bacterium]|jgi:predicted TIM-barrel fold metal-dependent hydrolase|nr:amidohydrolase family protein [Tepidisphaeraceae bacterium]